MKLDRNITSTGLGKYALVLCRNLSAVTADQLLRRAGKPDCFVEIESQALDLGAGPKGNFFVIRLKDRFAEPALREYAQAVRSEAAELRDSAESIDDPRQREAKQGIVRQAEELEEYAAEIDQEADTAEAYADQGKSKLPD